MYSQVNLERQRIVLLPKSEQMRLQVRRTPNVDEQLQSLIAKVCQYERTSPERQKALNRLLMVIEKLPQIYRSSHRDYPAAFNLTLEWVSKNIDSFEPKTSSVQQSFVVWINGYLKWRIRDLYLPDTQYELRRVYLKNPEEDNAIEFIETIPDPQSSLSLLDLKIAQLQAAHRQRQGEAVRQYIEQDLEGKLTECRLRKYPQCHCQLLAIKLLLQEPPQSIAEISRELEIKNQTLYSHWKQKCLPLLREIGCRFGNEL